MWFQSMGFLLLLSPSSWYFWRIYFAFWPFHTHLICSSVVYHLRGKSDICCQLLVLTIIHDLFGVDNMLHIHRVVVCIAQCTFCFTWWLNMSILSSCAMICLIKAVSFRFSYSIFMHMHFGILLKPPAVYLIQEITLLHLVMLKYSLMCFFLLCAVHIALYAFINQKEYTSYKCRLPSV